jgi:hypothetical protein
MKKKLIWIDLIRIDLIWAGWWIERLIEVGWFEAMHLIELLIEVELVHRLVGK